MKEQMTKTSKKKNYVPADWFRLVRLADVKRCGDENDDDEYESLDVEYRR